MDVKIAVKNFTNADNHEHRGVPFSIKSEFDPRVQHQSKSLCGASGNPQFSESSSKMGRQIPLSFSPGLPKFDNMCLVRRQDVATVLNKVRWNRCAIDAQSLTNIGSSKSAWGPFNGD